MLREGVREDGSACSELIEVGRLYHLVAKGTDGVEPLLIRHKEQEIRPGSGHLDIMAARDAPTSRGLGGFVGVAFRSLDDDPSTMTMTMTA